MGRGANIFWGVAWVTLWVAVAGVGFRYFAQHRAEGLAKSATASAAQVEAQKHTLAEELSLHDQQLRGKARDAMAKRTVEFEKALGGPALAAFKNPDFSIREALQRAANACAPTNTAVHIEVERFTEFRVTVMGGATISTNEMAAFARAFLPMAKSFVSEVRFSVRGTTVAELDRDDIEIIDDWTKAPVDRVARLLAIEAPAAPQDPGAAERLRQEQQLAETVAGDETARPKITAVERKFSDAQRRAYEDLNAALTLAHKAMSLDDVQRARDLDAHEKDLREAISLGNRAKEFWKAPEKKWRELLEAEGITPATVEALVKGFPITWRHNPDKAAKAFKALEAKFESSKYFLRLAGEQFGRWNFHAETGQYGFTDEEISRRFSRAQQQARDDSQALEAALTAWNEAVAQ